MKVSIKPSEVLCKGLIGLEFNFRDKEGLSVKAIVKNADVETVRLAGKNKQTGADFIFSRKVVVATVAFGDKVVAVPLFIVNSAGKATLQIDGVDKPFELFNAEAFSELSNGFTYLWAEKEGWTWERISQALVLHLGSL